MQAGSFGMTKNEIIALLAGDRRVERLIANICKRSGPDIDDLAQIIYEALLRYDAAKIIYLFENEQIDYFIVRIIENQYFSKTSPFFAQIRRFRARADDFVGGTDDEGSY